MEDTSADLSPIFSVHPRELHNFWRSNYYLMCLNQTYDLENCDRCKNKSVLTLLVVG
ncbi:MAG: hypothetical protein ACLQG5_09595 [Methanobacterium sp.]